jgi:hypothetical protein
LELLQLLLAFGFIRFLLLFLGFNLLLLDLVILAEFFSFAVHLLAWFAVGLLVIFVVLRFSFIFIP